ncbi:glycosyltransferase family 4 protein [Patescibacteria group bacterium]|nr:glycosyltransferase family 4 protein [Patescibacteria group bacterium]
MKQLSIAIFGGRKFLDSKSVVDENIQRLATGLVESGAEVNLYTDSCIKEKKFNGIVLHGAISFFGFSIPVVNKIWHFLHASINRGENIIYLHDIQSMALCPLFRIVRPQSTIVIHAYGNYEKYVKNIFSRYIFSVACRFADEVMVDNANLQSYIKKEFGVRARHLPMIVNAKRVAISEILLKAMNLASYRFVLAPVSLHNEKNIQTIVSAWKLLYKKRIVKQTGTKLAVVLAESNKQLAGNLQKYFLGDDSIVFLGKQKGESLQALFAGARFVVYSQTDLSEVLEAMSYGKAVIANKQKGIAQILEDFGCVYKKNNTDDLMKQMLFLMTDSMQCAAFGHSARCFVESVHGSAEVVQEVVSVFTELQAVRSGVLAIK